MNGDSITILINPYFLMILLLLEQKVLLLHFIFIIDTSDGQYEQPPSWGPGIASGANHDGIGWLLLNNLMNTILCLFNISIMIIF